MAKRILDLAKELGIDVEEVQRLAVSCNIVVSGPTTMIDMDDEQKIREAAKNRQGKSLSISGTRRVTLKAPGGQRSGGARTTGRGRTVEVAVRRRHARVRMAAEVKGADKAGAASPASRAAEAVKQGAAAAEASAKVSARQSSPATSRPATKASEQASAPPAQKTRSQQEVASAAASNAPSETSRASAKQPSQTAAQKGPRTTMRRGLTPAQIAAAKAPSSSLQEIERQISEERSQRRRQSTRSTSRPSGPGAVRRPPSVAAAPQPSALSPDTGRRREAARPKRRLSPAEKAARRLYMEQRHMVLTPQEEERMARLARGVKSAKRKKTITKDDESFVVRTVEVTDPIMISDLANRMAVKASEVIKKLLEMGVMATVNDVIDADTALLLVEEFGHKAKLINEAAVEDKLIDEPEEDEEEHLVPRPPVVVVMGHVDHGKTSLLDALRKANVAESEAGGITQHIGAYMVKLESGERVVFIDTPGHEAFTALRARGAKLTDVAVLVVAADDGVMPQTIEAVNHARAAEVPIIVAINKIDKEGADPEKVKRQLAEVGVIPEEWGGDTIFVPVSARTGEGLDELLEMLALQTEILELKANPNRRGKGIIIESRLDKGRGPVATVLVQNGTFKRGDIVVTGTVSGRVRAIIDENGVQHRTAGPSVPFELLGLDAVPEAGQEIHAVESEKVAREIVSYRKEKEQQLGAQAKKRASLDELFADMQSGIKEIPVLIKGDVTGSVEAIADALGKLGTDEVRVKVVHKAIGGITESDVMLASASNAIIIGFNVRPEAKAKKLAETEGVDIRFYKVIYDAIEEMKAAMAGMLAPEKVEKVTGTAEVREVFQVPKVGAVAGCYVTDGFVRRNSHVRVLRENVLVYDGVIGSLRRFKDDVREVKAGYECGINVEKFNDVKPGDTFEFYIIEEVAPKL